MIKIEQQNIMIFPRVRKTSGKTIAQDLVAMTPDDVAKELKKVMEFIWTEPLMKDVMKRPK